MTRNLEALQQNLGLRTPLHLLHEEQHAEKNEPHGPVTQG